MKVILFFLIAISSSFAINCGDFTGEFKTYDGHYYAVTGNKMSFQNAKNFAEASGGYMVIPNSSSENTFIKSLIGGNNEVWIGIYDPNYTQNLCFTANCFSTNRTRFRTVTGASLSYQNWDSIDVENQFLEGDDAIDLYGRPIISLLGEHWTLMSGNTGLWRDWGTHFMSGENPATAKAIIEFDTKPICYNEPSTITDEITGRVCNSQVWDSVIGVSDGTTADCMYDINDIEYCPQSLAECAQSWDYEDGYSVSGVGTVVDYTSKVATTTYISQLQMRWHGMEGGALGTWGYREDGSVVSTTRNFDDGWKDVASWIYATNAIFQKACGSGNCGEKLLGYNYIDYRVTSTGQLQMRWHGIEGSTILGGWSREHGTIVPHLGTYRNFDDDWKDVASWRYATNVLYERTSLGVIREVGHNYIDYRVNLVPQTTYTCPSGYSDNGSNCEKNVNYTYYNYLCSSGYTATTTGGDTDKTDPDTSTDDTSTLDDPLNSSTPPTNNCKKEKFTCLANESRLCAYVDGKHQCSPFPCVGESDFERLGTVEGANDKNNSGWSNDGECDGQIYIFNGKDHRCRVKDKFFGLIGGGCCDKDKVFFGLVACLENEKMLAKKRQNDLCHYVGTYCSKELEFIGCIQTSESHCCFNSKLARIIHEQGRPQIGLSWGSGDSPNCRGFKPEEFQKLDMSKMNLSEAFEDIKISTANISTITTHIQNKVNDINVTMSR